jgi:ABC-type polysaccharide/polyol phosphate transport system ATPase subunit
MGKIIFENVSLDYPIYDARSTSLRNALIKISTGGIIEKSGTNSVAIKALNNVSFEINKGDSVGLVGHNGAGKTTLLRTMAGIYGPTSGTVKLQGSVSTIIELGAGMEEELSGYENIIRMGLLMGLSKTFISSKIPEIEEFTELGNFLAMPTRTYSAGMTIRLMFAVATCVKQDILLVDEMFATGDKDFQRKAYDRINDLINHADIFVFASHSEELIEKFCNRIFYLEHGMVKEIF